MLKLHNTTIYKQNLGSVIAIFITGERNDCEAVFNSFYHHGATDCVNDQEFDRLTSKKLKSDEKRGYDEQLKRLHFFITSENGDCWQKLYESLVKMAQGELMNKGKKYMKALRLAWKIAEERIEAMESVNWYCIKNNIWDHFEFGTSIAAEKGTGNADDDLLGVIVSNSASHEGVSKTEAEAELDPDLVEA